MLTLKKTYLARYSAGSILLPMEKRLGLSIIIDPAMIVSAKRKNLTATKTFFAMQWDVK